MPERIKNKMVVDHLWPDYQSSLDWPSLPEEFEEKSNGPGRRNIQTGVFVPEEDAFQYALEQCTCCVNCSPWRVHEIKWTQEFKDMLVDWFYSENWVKED